MNPGDGLTHIYLRKDARRYAENTKTNPNRDSLDAIALATVAGVSQCISGGTRQNHALCLSTTRCLHLTFPELGRPLGDSDFVKEIDKLLSSDLLPK
jgi:hypothetical protein